ncbi:putative aminoglycoside phosphotransferase [Desulforapulum autotrophicum HRM2]|uniref:Aminoglycoside phosphotransferase n=1 Tax=Desulforapulum autotrophicum (strain ATCC 43914 / DSM 3382 / VKM B-1955 / HRM2) TaxID=177437 RepID=C0QGF0_DESAH|nr:phosphotransferase family protein [Desulforapulum autotrophicum]ACN13425.1 putative aminoglycoside phosphotransferase [Desulforapulum autotrophicum HRM2]
MQVTDQAVGVREGEALDPKKVRLFLDKTLPDLTGELTIRQFPSGFSNLTYQIRVGDQELVLRRPPVGAKIKSAHDMGREYRILTALHPVFPLCPKPLAFSEDPATMGCPFYIMEKIKGIILRKDLPAGLTFTPDQAHTLCTNLVRLQADLHAIDVRSAGLAFLGKPEGYVARQVKGWSERYRNARTPDAPDFEKVMAWLKEKMQPDTDSPTLVHNDYKLDNVVLNPQSPMEIIGVLDWEMATYGDPLMDLGNSLAYWIDRTDPEECQMLRGGPTNLDGALTRREIIDLYAEITGRSMDAFDFYLCFGMFRLAVIAQQIYQRYHKGITRDPRFAMLIGAVQILERAALRLMDNSKL